jgi:ribonuclease E
VNEEQMGMAEQAREQAPPPVAPQNDPAPQAPQAPAGEPREAAVGGEAAAAGDAGAVAATSDDAIEGAAAGPPGAGGAPADAAQRPKRRRRGRRGGRRHKKKPAGAAGSPGADGADDSDDDDDDDEEGAPQTRTARPARAPRAANGTDAAEDTAARADGADGAEASEGEAAPRAPRQPRAQGQRAPQGQRAQGGQRQAQTRAPRPPRAPAAGAASGAGGATSAGGEATESATDAAADAADDRDEAVTAADGTAPAKRKRRRRGRGRSGGGAARKPGEGAADGSAQPGEAKEPKEPAERRDRKPAAGGSTRMAARALRKTQGRQQGRHRRRLTEEEAQRLRGGAKTMLVHVHDDRTQIGVLEEGSLIEHYVARRGHRSTLAGNIFLGRVQNVLPGMEAAFVDFGRGRNGVLYAGEVNYAAEDIEGGVVPRIEKVLKPGQSIMVQVTKDPIGSKGARLTSQISLAGRYMVIAPEQQVSGISRRLAENERTRLRQILRDIAPKEHGVIVRTAAEGATREALERDLQSLLKIWDQVQKTSKKAKAPHLLYAEPELVNRVVRDIFSGDFEKVVVDARAVHDEIKEYLDETAPDLLEKLELYEGALPLFEEYRVTEQIHKALERKVWLPSGGSIVIDRTEAMTVVDVNTGKFTGKGTNLEETVFKNNLEAAEEVARQLRLRDIGGIIVVDFIDMIDPKNQQEVLRTLKRALSRDKTRSQVFEVSNLGLVEMTRKRVSEGLLEAFSEPCPNCDGRGIVLTHEID